MEEISPGNLDLARYVRAGDHVVCGQGPAEPRTLTEALVAQRAHLGGAGIFLGTMFSSTFAPEQADWLKFTAWCGIGTNVRLARAKVLDVVPADYSQLPLLFAGGQLPCDVALIQLSPPNRAGRHSAGNMCDYVLDAARRARTVIAEVNDQVPWTYCADGLDRLRIDAVIRTSRPVIELPTRPASAVARRIAAHAAPFIEDGAVLQTGIGAIPDAILHAVGSRRDLGIHSGLITDAVLDLVESGAVTNARKAIDAGCSITGALYGTSRLGHFAAGNVGIRLHSSIYTHDPSVLARLSSFVAINGALEVDLTGQVNAEMVGGTYVGAVGGHGDFVRAALRSPGGHSVIALQATAQGGARSRIVGQLSGGVTTTPRSNADLVVTEFGVAQLRGQTLAERVRRMIAIADPAFRRALTRAAAT